MTKSTKSLSVRERKQKQEMRRWLMIGGGAFALAAAAGVGSTFMDPSFPTLEGKETIGERIRNAGMSSQVLTLTPGDGTPDILVIGSTDCSFCRSFIKDGLDDLIEFAEENKLSVVYTGIGNSPSSLASTRLVGGFARHSDAAPGVILKSVYDAAEEISFGGKAEIVAEAYAKKLNVSAREIRQVLDESALDVTRRIQTTVRTFPVAGTPMFFVANEGEPSRINMFGGWSGKGGLRRQIEAARSV